MDEENAVHVLWYCEIRSNVILREDMRFDSQYRLAAWLEVFCVLCVVCCVQRDVYGTSEICRILLLHKAMQIRWTERC